VPDQDDQNQGDLATLIEVPEALRLHELAGSGKLSFSKDGIVGTRIYQVPVVHPVTGVHYLDWIADMLGRPATKDTAKAYPDVFDEDNLDWLFALECETTPIEGFLAGTRQAPPGEDPESDAVKQRKAKNKSGVARARYKAVVATFKYAALSVNESIKGAVDVLSLPGESFGWSHKAPGVLDFQALPAFPQAPDVLREDVGRLVPKGTYNFELHQVYAPQFLKLFGLLGKVNKTPFLDFPTAALLLASVEGRRSYTPTGLKTYDLQFEFLTNLNPGGHVALYRSDKGEFWIPRTLAKTADDVLGQQKDPAKPPAPEHDLIFRPADFSIIFEFF
jgi:hypothetical protein